MRKMYKPYIRQGRYYMTVDGKRMPRAYVVWNKYHPNDPILKGEVIHHKNENKLDDHHDNLQKMTAFEHKQLHSGVGVKALNEFRKGNPEKAHEQSSQAAKLLHQRMKLDPKFAEWVKSQRREGVIKFNKSRKGEKRSQEYKDQKKEFWIKYWSDPENRRKRSEQMKERHERRRKVAK
jgi:hypothetical protein